MSIISDATLARQLRRLKLDEHTPPSPDDWRRLLQYLNSHYQHVDEDRNMMARSLEVSTQEMTEIRAYVQAERDQLQSVVLMLRRAIEEFAHACRETRNSGGEDTTAITGARKHFNLAVIKMLTQEQLISEESRSFLESLRASFINLFQEVISMVAPDSAITEEAILLHKRLIPPGGEHELDGFKLSARCEQLSGLGGDLWFHKSLDAGQEFICIGDATGHGVTAGFFSAMVAAFIEAWLKEQRVVELERLALQLNEFVSALGQQKLFMTWCGLIVDHAQRTVSVLNAGHNFPILVRHGEARSMVVPGDPLGAFGETRAKQGRVQLEAGDKLVLFTDGYSETRNEMGGEYGERSLKAFLETRASSAPGEVTRALWDEVELFRANARRSDDATVVIIEVR